MGEEVSGGLDEPPGLQPEQGALRLAAPEDTATRSDWERAAAAVLRRTGRLAQDADDDTVWSALTRTTSEGIEVPPLGIPGAPPAWRPERHGPWDVRAYAGCGPAALVNQEVIADLQGGATSAWVGVRPDCDLAALLADVRLDLAAVVLRSAGDQEATARDFLDWVDGDVHPATNLGVDAAQATPELLALARDAGVLGFVVDASTVHDRGAGDAQELGWALATGAAYLRTMEAAGIAVEDAAGCVEFRIAVTDVQLLAIAKLRAARWAWARMLELSGSTPVPLRLHAVTSAPMMSRFDPWVNMLRGTVAAFAGGVGGADAVTVVPFDSPLGRPDAFGRRIARNVSSLLVAESHVAAVADPAGGAYAVEELTHDLAEAAWAELGLIERQGQEAFAERLRAVRERRRADVAHRRRPITGLSEFPQLGEVLPERPTWDEHAGTQFYGADFEAFRADPVEGHVFLATLGPVAQHTARARFATNLLAAGGVTVDVAGATNVVDDLVAAYDGQSVVCLAGTDAAYAEWGGQAAEALGHGGAAYVSVVWPGQTDPPAWVSDCFRPGDDAVAFLGRIRKALS